jgi:hypothetical protein
MKISVCGSSKKILDENTQKQYWYPILQKLESRGHKLTSEFDADFLLAINHDPHALSKFGSKYPDRPKFLLRTEPPSVFPKQYSANISKLYDVIITPGGSRDLQDESFYLWPYYYLKSPFFIDENLADIKEIVNERYSDHLYEMNSWKKRTIFCSFIASNKISPTDEGFYGLREEIVSANKLGLISIFGYGWNASVIERISQRIAMLRFSLLNLQSVALGIFFKGLFKRYKTNGEIENKHSIMLQSKYSLVIENSPHFLTEKIFDSFINGSIPIYLGPDLSEFGIPSNCYIQAPPDCKKILELIANLEQGGSQELLLGIQDFLKSKEFEEFLGDSVYDQVVDQMLTHANSKFH